MTQHIVNRLSRERRNDLLRKSHDLGDRIRQDRRNPNVWLVGSSQHPGLWYRVRDGVSCGCMWHHKTGQPCRHLVRTSWELYQSRKREEAAA